MAKGPVEKDIDLSTGLQMHYFEWQGNGPTLIFLHPSSGYGRMWEFTASHLSPNFQMYSLEQRGHGDSSKPDGGYTGEEYSEDLRAFMEAQGIAQAILVGHSLGGRVAQIFAGTYPRLTQAVVLAAGPHYESFFQAAPIVDSVLQNAEKIRSAPKEFTTKEEVIRYNHERYPTLSEEMIRHRVQYNFRCLPNGKFGPKYDPLRVAQGLTHIPDDLTRYAREITCPMAFVIGKSSTQITRSNAEKVASCYQKTKVNIYEVEAGNVLQVENPSALARVIKEFVKLFL